MEPGHRSGYARHLKSKHPFAPAAQLISSSDEKNRRVAPWADHRWNEERLESENTVLYETPYFHPLTTPLE